MKKKEIMYILGYATAISCMLTFLITFMIAGITGTYMVNTNYWMEHWTEVILVSIGLICFLKTSKFRIRVKKHVEMS